MMVGPDVHFFLRLGIFLSFISLIFFLESGDISASFSEIFSERNGLMLGLIVG